MDYKIKYLETSLIDMMEIKQYLDQYSEKAWVALVDNFEKQIDALRAFPLMGSPYKKYRRLICGDYIAFYRVDKNNETVEIMRFLHGSRDIGQYL